jgi:signal transduction histidine kinase
MADGDGIHVRVRDTGVGIALENQRRIFDPFDRAPAAAARAVHGAGLGLTISRHLARSMGGDLSVDSRPGAGACFTLRLPPVTDIGGSMRAASGSESLVSRSHG